MEKIRVTLAAQPGVAIRQRAAWMLNGNPVSLVQCYLQAMPTLQQIQRQISRIKEADSFGTKKEIKSLPDILDESESVLGLTSGMLDGSTWLIVCTERRVIFLDKGLIYGLKQLETPLEKINSIQQKTGIVFGEIGIWDGSSKMQIKNVMKKTVRPFVEAVNRAREEQKKVEAVPSAQVVQETPPLDVVSQLERLAGLRERGILTEDEFNAQKEKILEG